MGLLILLIAMAIGFGVGYGVREMISRRRRRAARGERGESQRSEAAVAPAADDAINLERLLVAANDDITGRRRQSLPDAGQPVDPKTRSEEFDGAVRDLLGELNRRPERSASMLSRVSPLAGLQSSSER
ncbi:hypothetical protein JQ633_24200 [Bradyrhizobium tropiciagri]|uniref:hypothetical protein n=1 Tax=Bradyrhizobium tropiciagri TaxID=312253 RepID=UPI001BA4FE9F|nr:hypothetical protein [Bradyrhizobium tropiciagri]MBR0873481.1 hypothetical protein [Bradyrhizobium tropiciagri]